MKKVFFSLFSIMILAACQNEANLKPEKTKTEVKTMEKAEFVDGTLLKATSANDLAAVKHIVENQENVVIDEQNAQGETPLLIATHKNYPEMAIYLMENGADINVQDSIQDSPFLYAGAQGRTEILTFMLENKTPDVKKVNRYGGNALIPAAEKGHLDNVKLLLAHPSTDIDHQNNFGYTALIEAVALTDGSKLYQQIVAELLEGGANKELRDNNGMTALDYAKQQQNQAMMGLLQE
ncbi:MULTISPECIES: ankyrin repeat domain-containing protein [Listeria]|uniref:ankyrin repeat domain-containing protein n=1 Tax=Listeria TaxID=1637 RepID=UPI000B58DE7C|nr:MULTISPECIES: ankyrin repeat domain-containing protein [Listeria]